MEDPNALEREHNDSCWCLACALRKMLLSMMRGGLPYPDDSAEGRWIGYQKAMAHLRGHAQETSNQRAGVWQRQLGLGQTFQASGLGPLTGYQMMARDVTLTPTIKRTQEEMRLIASLITPLLKQLLESVRPLAELVAEKDSRWRFFDHVIYFDSLLMVRTVLLDIGHADQDAMLENLDVIEEMGKLVAKCNQTLLQLPDDKI